MILNHLIQSNPGHAGRPGQVGGSAPSGMPPPPPGAKAAYTNLKSSDAPIENDSDYQKRLDEYRKMYTRAFGELNDKVRKGTASPQEKQEWTDARKQLSKDKTMLEAYERANNKVGGVKQIHQDFGVSQSKSTSISSTPKPPSKPGGWRTPEAKEQYTQLLNQVKEISLKVNEFAKNPPKFTVLTPEIKQSLRTYLELNDQLEKLKQQKEDFFQKNYEMGT